MTGVGSVDEQLTAAHARREQLTDFVVRSLVEIDTLTTRLDVLLDRKGAPA